MDGRQTKGIKRITRIGYGHLCLREENFRFIINTYNICLFSVRFICNRYSLTRSLWFSCFKTQSSLWILHLLLADRWTIPSEHLVSFSVVNSLIGLQVYFERIAENSICKCFYLFLAFVAYWRITFRNLMILIVNSSVFANNHMILKCS